MFIGGGGVSPIHRKWWGYYLQESGHSTSFGGGCVAHLIRKDPSTSLGGGYGHHV